MNKIPVWETVGRTYAFAFRRYPANLGVVWLPFVLMGVLAWHFMLPALTEMSAAMVDMARHRSEAPQTPYISPLLGHAIGAFVVFEFLLLFVLFPVMAVGVTKNALGIRAVWPFAYVGIGKRELWIAAGVALFALFYMSGAMVIGIVFGIVGGIVGGIMVAARAGAHGGADNVAAMVATITLVTRIGTSGYLLVAFYFFVRLCYLMVPVSAAENRFGLWRSWTLTRGNFWRIAGVMVATLLPLTILSYAAWFLVVGPEAFFRMIDLQIHPDASGRGFAGLVESLQQHVAASWAIFSVAAPVSYGLMFGQSAFAYRALVPAGEHGKADEGGIGQGR